MNKFIILFALWVNEVAAKKKPPNILFLMCDSMDGRVVDPTSPVSKMVHTPYFDSLASEGVNFVRTYTPSPQCVPARTAMVTGRRTDQIRCFENGIGIAASLNGTLDLNCLDKFDEETCTTWKNEQGVIETFYDTIETAGLDVQLFGKLDVGANTLTRFGPHVSFSGFIQGPDLSTISRSADIRKPTRSNPLDFTHDDVDEVHPEDWKTIGECIEWLKNRGDSQIDDPFFLWCSLSIPHPPFQTNETWLNYVDISKVTSPQWLDYGIHPSDSYMSISKNVNGNFTVEDILKVRKTYFAMCAETDYMLGQVLQATMNAGLYNDTIVIFVSDHGEMNMEHRQVWKNSFYEASSRVPMIISGGSVAGKVFPRGSVVTNLTSLLDIYPTLMTLLEKKVPKHLSGSTLTPFLGKPVVARKDYVISQYFSNFDDTGVFMIRQGPWKYITFGNVFSTFAKSNGYVPQLFNLDDDPDEIVDLAADQPGIVAGMDRLLRKELASGKNVISQKGDYQEIDRFVKQLQQNLYKRFYLNSTNINERYSLVCNDKYSDVEYTCLSNAGPISDDEKLKQMFKKTYKGFDDADWEKVQSWISEKH